MGNRDELHKLVVLHKHLLLPMCHDPSDFENHCDTEGLSVEQQENEEI